MVSYMEFGVKFDEIVHEKSKVISRFLEIFDASNEGLWEMTSDNEVNFYNTNFHESFDVTLNGSNFDEWFSLIHRDDTTYFTNKIHQQLSQNLEKFKSQYRVLNVSGEYVWIEATGVAKYDYNGRMLYMVGSHKDITQQKDVERQIYKIAYVDRLTGLLNKESLVKDLQRKIEIGDDGALIYLNL